ncbi:glycosyltransferase family protein [Methylobacterium radiotolerans]|uniref:hypothetical protein n=1 Tax=Methylobacterium radiotolerans TaxID=31998 RepID=UPI000D1E8676|nr:MULTISPECIES: hypothetical protein [Methylobacterium]MDE3749500.1 hypothetical protein [Methylobacterium radiotolerans]
MSEDVTAVVFLARGYEEDHLERFQRFIRSYGTFSAGQSNHLHVIFKGFRTALHERSGRALFKAIPHTAHLVDDAGFDLGAYAAVLSRLDEPYVCFLNSNAEILSEHWLRKLISYLRDPAVGMVGATGSCESLNYLDPDFPRFPNPHLRTNAFALRTDDAQRFFGGISIRDKIDAWRFESGPDSLTRRVFSAALTCLIVGRDGRGYGPSTWIGSETFRQGLQSNLLVGDNVTRAYLEMSPSERGRIVSKTWGRFVHPKLFCSAL